MADIPVERATICAAAVPGTIPVTMIVAAAGIGITTGTPIDLVITTIGIPLGPTIGTRGVATMIIEGDLGMEDPGMEDPMIGSEVMVMTTGIVTMVVIAIARGLQEVRLVMKFVYCLKLYIP